MTNCCAVQKLKPANADDMVDAHLAAASAWLDGMIVAEMRALVLSAGDLANHPCACAAIDRCRERLERWRDQRIDELHAAMLRETGRLH
jgi:hypothetical protein